MLNRLLLGQQSYSANAAAGRHMMLCCWSRCDQQQTASLVTEYAYLLSQGTVLEQTLWSNSRWFAPENYNNKAGVLTLDLAFCNIR